MRGIGEYGAHSNLSHSAFILSILLILSKIKAVIRSNRCWDVRSTPPGSKVWDFDYNALGQPTGYTAPNGVETAYSYDSRNRLTKIEHVDGMVTLASFDYSLDDGGLITKTTQEDGSYWDYGYDNRYRLTTANRFESGGNIKAAYSYTYDAGDNMLTKVEPFLDDFNDGNYTGWTISGTMSASNNYLESTGSGAPIASLSNSDPSNEVTLRYNINNTSDSLTRAYIIYRFTDWSNYEWVRIYPSSINIGKNVSGTGTQIASGSATSTANTWYNLRIVADGANVKVYRWADGSMPSLICSTTSSPNQSTSSFKISVNSGYLFDFDDICILSDSLSSTTTFAVNNANELTSMTDYNGTTSFGFDGWGRMTSKSLGSYSASYGYKYGQMLCSVTSNFPGEGNVTYNYGGNFQRRERTANSTTTKYNWNGGFGLISEEDNSGNLTRSYTGRLADVSGSNPGSGSYRYYHGDNLGSARLVTDGSSDTLATNRFTPFGSTLMATGASTMWSFANLANDGTSGLNFAPFRYYSAAQARWTSRDPLGLRGGPNQFAYVANSPIIGTDPLGLLWPVLVGALLGGIAGGVVCGLQGGGWVNHGWWKGALVGGGATLAGMVGGAMAAGGGGLLLGAIGGSATGAGLSWAVGWDPMMGALGGGIGGLAGAAAAARAAATGLSEAGQAAADLIYGGVGGADAALVGGVLTGAC